jgi:hypothetical protein
MRRVFERVFACTLVVGISSCSVRANFEGQPVPRSSETAPIALSVAVLSDRSLRFDYPPIVSLGEFEEVMNPGLAETLRNGFDPAFREVLIVENERDATQTNVIASPALKVSDPLTLTVTFKESRSGRELARLSSSRSLDGHAFGMYSHLGTDFLLFATAVVLPPLDPVVAHSIRRHQAERFNAMFTPAVVEMVSDIAKQASHDAALKSIATIRN